LTRTSAAHSVEAVDGLDEGVMISVIVVETVLVETVVAIVLVEIVLVEIVLETVLVETVVEIVSEAALATT